MPTTSDKQYYEDMLAALQDYGAATTGPSSSVFSGGIPNVMQQPALFGGQMPQAKAKAAGEGTAGAPGFREMLRRRRLAMMGQPVEK